MFSLSNSIFVVTSSALSKPFTTPFTKFSMVSLVIKSFPFSFSSKIPFLYSSFVLSVDSKNIHLIANNINIIDKPNNIFDVISPVIAVLIIFPTVFVSNQPNIVRHKITDIISIKLEKSVKDAKDNVKTEAYKVKAEIDKLNDADSEFVTDKTKKEAFDAEVNKQALADDAAESKALKTANENYDAKLLEELNKDKAEGEKFAKVADAPADAQNAAKEALKESDEARALKTAENNVRVAKEKMVRESTDDSVKNIVNEFDDAVEAAKTKKNEKIASLVQDDQMKASLEKIKKLFPKEGKGKAALMWGGIAAAVGLVAGLVLGGNNKKQV